VGIVVRFTTKTKVIHSLHRVWTGCGANAPQVQYIPGKLTFRWPCYVINYLIKPTTRCTADSLRATVSKSV